MPKLNRYSGSRHDVEVSDHLKDVADDITVKTKIIVDGKPTWTTPTTAKQTLKLPTRNSSFTADRNFYFVIEDTQATVSGEAEGK